MGDFFKKHKTVVIILIVAVVLIAAGVVYAIVHNPGASDPSDTDTGSVSDTVDAISGNEQDTTDIPSGDAGDTTIPSAGVDSADHDHDHDHSHDPDISGDNTNSINTGSTIPTSPETSVGDPTHNHSYTVWKIMTPTCTVKGYTIYQCSCGATEIRDYKDLADHSYGEWVVKRQATAESDGEKTRSCVNCGNTETAVIPKTADGDSSGVLEIKGSDQYGDYRRIEIKSNENGIDKYYVIRDYRAEGSELSYEMQSEGLMIYYASLDGSIKKDFLLQFPSDKNEYRLAMFTILSDGTSKYKYFYSND